MYFRMKRILLICIALAAACTVYASNWREDCFREMFPYRYEVRIGWGPRAISDEYYILRTPSYSLNDKSYYPNTPTLDSVYGEANGADYMTGAITGEFSIHLKRWFSFSTMLSVNNMWGSLYSQKDGHVTKRKHAVTVGILPQARIYWYNQDSGRLYSSFGLGFHACVGYDGRTEFNQISQFTPIGYTAGSRVFFFAELSYGEVFTGGQFGVGCRF